MSAEGGGILAYLDAAITQFERVATAAAALQGDPENGWGIVDNSAYAQPSQARHISPHIGLTHEPEPAEHITLNNPAAVLRRCAADRRLLKLHGGWAHSCPAFDEDGDYDGQVHFYNHEICPTIQHLAESYGWTESA